MAGFVEVEVKTRSGSVQVRDELGRFTSEVERGCEAAAERGSQMGRDIAAEIFDGAGVFQGAVFFTAGDNDFAAEGQWAEAAEFGIPPHSISTDKYSLYNPEEGFPSVINQRTGKPMQVQHVNHPGTPEIAMIRSAGDEVAAAFEGILDVYLP